VLLVAATVLSLWWLSPAIAADHRDAPTAGDYSAIDINDVYVFRDPADHRRLVVALTTQAVAAGYPNGRQPSDWTTDILIGLILQIPAFTDGTATKTYCSVFPFLGPPLQLSGRAPFQIIQQSCP